MYTEHAVLATARLTLARDDFADIVKHAKYNFPL